MVVIGLHINGVGQRLGVELLVCYPPVLTGIVVRRDDDFLGFRPLCEDDKVAGIDFRRIVVRQVDFESEVGVVLLDVVETIG